MKFNFKIEKKDFGCHPEWDGNGVPSGLLNKYPFSGLFFNSKTSEYNDVVMSLPDEFEIEGVSTQEFARVVIAAVELSFLLLRQKAERNLPIRGVEEEIGGYKKQLKLLSAHPDGEVFPFAVSRIDDLKLAYLSALPKGCQDQVLGFPAWKLGEWQGRALAILEEPLQVQLPAIRVLWDGEHFVAIHELALAPAVLKLLEPPAAEGR